jgi:FixJ family two-component response regulator
MMPNMTGAQLLEEVARKYPGTPLILATGYAELPAGVTVESVRLSKPYTQAELAGAIAKAVVALQGA